MKKKIDPASITNELKGASSFFKPIPQSRPAPPPPSNVSHSERPRTQEQVIPQPVRPKTKELKEERSVPTSRPLPSPTDSTETRDTTVSRYHDTILETARRAVKQLGKEAATYRFTVEEKKALKNVERDYEDKNIRTSENEITRISINYILEDYRLNGKNSVLATILDILHS